MDRIYVRTIESLIILGLSSMVALTFTSTAYRMLGYGGIYWAEEVTRYISIWVVFLASGLGVRYGIHLSVDLILQLLPQSLGRIFSLFALTMMLIFAGVLLYFGIEFSVDNFSQRSASLQIPMSFANAAIPVGAALMIFETLRLAVIEIRGQKDGNASD